MRSCAQCGGEVAVEHRFCPWCAAPQRLKLVRFFRPAATIEADRGKMLRVSFYVGAPGDDQHVRFSVWNEEGVAEAAVSLSPAAAQRLAAFVNSLCGTPPSRLSAILGVRPSGRPAGVLLGPLTGCTDATESDWLEALAADPDGSNLVPACAQWESVATMSSVPCDSCGYASPIRGLVEINFDSDIEATVSMLEQKSLVEPCPVCDSPVRTAAAAAFIDEVDGLVVCLAEGDHGAKLAQGLQHAKGESARFVLERREQDAANAVEVHLRSVGAEAEVISPKLFEALRSDSGEEELTVLAMTLSEPRPSRRHLTALALTRLNEAQGLAPYLAMGVSREGLTDRADTLSMLDAAVPPWLIGERAIARLVGVGMGFGAVAALGEPPPDFPAPEVILPLEVRASPVLAGAWAADRSGTTFAPPGPAVWATCVVDWLEECADAPSSIGPDDFLRRTVDNVQVATVAVTKLAGGRDRMALIDSLETRGLFGGIDFAEYLARFMSEAERSGN